LLPTKTLKAIPRSSKTGSSSDKTAKQNDPTAANRANDSLVRELPASDPTTASVLGVPQPDPTGEFIRFPKLPAELREEIWILSLPGPRDIMIRLDPQDMRALDVSDIKEDEHPYYRAKAYAGAVPAHLHVNQESRAVAKIYYELDFEKQTRGRPIYVDFKTDTICLLDDKSFYAFYGRHLSRGWKNTKEDLKYMRATEAKIQSLIVMGRRIPWRWIEMGNWFHRFTNLHKLCYIGRAQNAEYHHYMERWFRRSLQGGPWKKDREPCIEALAEPNFRIRFQHLL
jgi:hypothetical protein